MMMMMMMRLSKLINILF